MLTASCQWPSLQLSTLMSNQLHAHSSDTPNADSAGAGDCLFLSELSTDFTAR